MPKKVLKRLLPSLEKLRTQKNLAIFHRWLDQSNLWYLNRRSVSRATAIGLFVTLLPLPFHMVVAAALAIVLQANLPIALLLVWLNSPITMPFVFYGTYKLGAWILNSPTYQGPLKCSWQWMKLNFYHIGTPVLIGSLLCGLIAALLGFWGVHLYWGYMVKRRWHQRKQRRSQ